MTRAKTEAGVALLAAFQVALCQPMVFTVDFGQYAGYEGSLRINGSVAVMETSSEGVQQLLWDVSGVDTSCTPGAGDAIPGGCGIDIHTGTTCKNASEVGPHFHNVTQSPWGDVVYVSDSSGRSVGSATVTTGLHVSDFAGRALVVHQRVSGERAACGVLAASASVSSAGFSPYPGYAGNLAVSGSVTLAAASDSTQLLTWELFGLGLACESLNTADNVTNGCGMHVHSGTTCEDASLVGGHYFKTQSDPWLNAVYVADGSGASRGVALVDAGVSLSDIAGRAFVVHELADGGRVSCALLGESGLLRAASFGPYPGYSGSLDVKGTVIISDTGASGRQLVAWDLHGVDEACLAGAADGIANGCGLHIHAGATCAEAALVGGHLFLATEPDLWLDLRYVSDSSGRSRGSAEVQTGLDVAVLAGRAFVVHRKDSGARIACGMLFAAERTSTEKFVPYPGYNGSLRAEGSATLSVAGPASQQVAWDLTGLDASCSTEGVAHGIPNGCGIHVHAGMTCADKESVGGHFYNKSLSEDPWAEVRYVADANGSSTGSAIVSTGLPLNDMVGRAFVVHRLHDGGRVACGILETDLAPEQAPSSPPTEARASKGDGLVVEMAALGIAACAAAL